MTRLSTANTHARRTEETFDRVVTEEMTLSPGRYVTAHIRLTAVVAAENGQGYIEDCDAEVIEHAMHDAEGNALTMSDAEFDRMHHIIGANMEDWVESRLP